MTYHIAVCDDDNIAIQQVKNFILSVCEKMNISYITDTFLDGESLIKQLSSGVCYDLIFLDIEMPKVSGVQVGTAIRDIHKDELTQIVYISAKSEYALELFDSNPLNFLVKPINYEDIEKVIEKFVKITGNWSDVFTYKYGHDTYKMKLKDIIYLESSGKKIIIHAKSKNDEYYGSIEDAYESQLKRYGFLFIHRAYVVNYDHVTAFEYEKLTLTDKTTLPIGQARRKEIRNRQQELEKRRDLNG